MNVMTLRDYAKQNNISYEAVRKQVVRYQKELDGHLIKDGRQQFLDEEAVAFLDAKRQKNPVAIIQMDKDEQIENLERENKNLLIKVAELSNWKAENAVAIAEANQNKLLLESREKEIKALEAQNAKISDNLNEKDELLQKATKKAEDVNTELTKALEQIEKMKNASLMQRLFGWKKGV